MNSEKFPEIINKGKEKKRNKVKKPKTKITYCIRLFKSNTP